MISLMCLAAATVIGNVGVVSQTQNIKTDIPISEFITNNFSTFVDKYNDYHDESLLATKLIRIREIVLESKENGYYFDFDYGYMVATENYVVLLISNYDLPFEDDLFLDDNNIYFTGTAFYNTNGKEYGILEDNLLANNKAYSAVKTITEVYSNNRDGNINNSEINSYISVNYSGYNIVSQKFIKSYDYISQFDTSVYVRHADGYVSSEGNCVINSTFSMLHNMGKKDRNRNLYYSDYYINYTGNNLIHDGHYTLRNNIDGWRPNDLTRTGAPNKGKNPLEYMSDLYLRLRERAISSYGYDEENGMYSSYAKNMAMDVDGWFGYETNFYETNDFNTMKELINNDIPSIIVASNSITYNNHAMAVNGYIKLEKNSGWWIFSSSDTKWILSVDDGHQNSCINGGEDKRVFYDPNKQGGALFICADRNSIDFSVC